MIEGVQPEELDAYWPYLEGMVQMPLDRMDLNDMYTTDDVLTKLKGMYWQCWVAFEGNQPECVFITKVDQYPAGRKEIVVYLVGGKNIEHWLSDAWGLFKAYGKESGCSGIRGMGRKGWARVLGKYDNLDLQYSFVAEI